VCVCVPHGHRANGREYLIMAAVVAMMRGLPSGPLIQKIPRQLLSSYTTEAQLNSHLRGLCSLDIKTIPRYGIIFYFPHHLVHARFSRRAPTRQTGPAAARQALRLRWLSQKTSDELLVKTMLR
jgi:hypothetical protein